MSAAQRSAHPSPATALADEFVDFRLATEHDRALWRGTMDHLERWDDISIDGKVARTAELNRFADRADALQPGDDDDLLLLETIAFTSRASRDAQQWREELAWVNNANGLIPNLFTFLPRYPLVTPDDGDRYFDKIASLPALLDTWCFTLADSAGEGRATIEHVVRGLIATLDAHLAAPLSSGPLGRQPPPGELGDTEGSAWSSRLAAALDGDVTAALARLRATLANDVAPRARPDATPGLVHLEGGSDLYERLVWGSTTLELSAAEVHEIGLAQVALLEDEYRSVAGPLFGIDDMESIYGRLRDDESLRYRDAASIVADATKALEKATAAMGDWFGRVPRAACIATASQQGSLAFYSPPSTNGVKPGTFFFNTADPSMWGTYQLEAVTYHESIPGHHLQMAIAQEIEGLHRLLGEYFVTAYGEGWGLYTERLADEMGLYSSELDRVGMLAADSMRACRLVVDTGMHALAWTRDQAIRYVLDHSPLSERQVVNEIDRYIGNPGQALSYMIGRLQFDEIRANAEARLGERFDIRAFHDVVLGSGSITLRSLRRLVDTWAAQLPSG